MDAHQMGQSCWPGAGLVYAHAFGDAASKSQTTGSVIEFFIPESVAVVSVGDATWLIPSQFDQCSPGFGIFHVSGKVLFAVGLGPVSGVTAIAPIAVPGPQWIATWFGCYGVMHDANACE